MFNIFQSIFPTYLPSVLFPSNFPYGHFHKWGYPPPVGWWVEKPSRPSQVLAKQHSDAASFNWRAMLQGFGVGRTQLQWGPENGKAMEKPPKSHGLSWFIMVYLVIVVLVLFRPLMNILYHTMFFNHRNSESSHEQCGPKRQQKRYKGEVNQRKEVVAQQHLLTTQVWDLTSNEIDLSTNNMDSATNNRWSSLLQK